MDWLTMWVVVAAIGLLFYGATSMSRHRFDPRADKPNECRLCGRKRDKHPA